MTQAALAERLGLQDPSYIAKLETGTISNPRLDSMEKIADALDVAVSDLMDDATDEVERALAGSDLDDEARHVMIRIYRAFRAESRPRTDDEE
jgi:transcriptional regulator with XRE-family HTH domain